MPRWLVAVMLGAAVAVGLLRAFEVISVEIWFDFVSHLRVRDPASLTLSLLWLVLLGVAVGVVATAGARYHWLVPGTAAILLFLVTLPRLFGAFLPTWYPSWLVRTAQFGFSEAVHLSVGALALGATWPFLRHRSMSGQTRKEGGPRTALPKLPSGIALGCVSALVILWALRTVTPEYPRTALAGFHAQLLWMTLIGAGVAAVATAGARFHPSLPGLAAALLFAAFLPFLIDQMIPTWYPAWLDRWVAFALSPAVFVAVGILAFGGVWPNVERAVDERLGLGTGGIAAADPAGHIP